LALPEHRWPVATAGRHRRQKKLVVVSVDKPDRLSDLPPVSRHQELHRESIASSLRSRWTSPFAWKDPRARSAGTLAFRRSIAVLIRCRTYPFAHERASPSTRTLPSSPRQLGSSRVRLQLGDTTSERRARVGYVRMPAFCVRAAVGMRDRVLDLARVRRWRVLPREGATRADTRASSAGLSLSGLEPLAATAAGGWHEGRDADADRVLDGAARSPAGRLRSAELTAQLHHNW
jgi:hypothetical protein